MPRRPPGDEELELQLLALSRYTVRRIWERIRREGIEEFTRLSRQGLQAAEIAERVGSFLNGLSTKTDEMFAREAATVAYGLGRAAALVEAKRSGAATFALRSEILDVDTCEVCATLDGTVVEIGTDEFTQYKPPNLCRGGDRCRGFYMAAPMG